MTIEQYSKVILKDGRTATIVEILEDGATYLVDVDLPGPDWDTIEILQDDIKSFTSSIFSPKRFLIWLKTP